MGLEPTHLDMFIHNSIFVRLLHLQTKKTLLIGYITFENVYISKNLEGYTMHTNWFEK